MTSKKELVFDIEYFDTLASTNDLLKEMGEKGVPEGKVVVASHQTAGKGRGVGRSFYSPASTGLYMSLMLRPRGGFESSLKITTMAAVAVCRAISKVTGKSPKIKWVNDIILDGKKVCGILTEAAFKADGSGIDYAVLGIGVNLFLPEGGFPDDIKDIAGALCGEYDPTLRNRLADEILSEFSRIYCNEPYTYMDEYRALSCVIGKKVRIYRNPSINIGEPDDIAYAYGIDDGCRLLIKHPDGREEALFSGEISVRY
jgi:BirA family biotin operon repressor/biotin-[acetyl-CoA-carboxylase] ligase